MSIYFNAITIAPNTMRTFGTLHFLVAVERDISIHWIDSVSRRHHGRRCTLESI